MPLAVAIAAVLTIGGQINAPLAETRAASNPGTIFPNPQTAELAEAVAGNDAAKVREAVKRGADLADHGKNGVTLLQWAMLRDRPAMLALLVELGADPSQRGYGGQTALHTAAMAKGKPYLKFLLDSGADPNARGGATDAPVLSEALMNGNKDAVALLLAHHADPNATDRQDDTPLHIAAQISDYTMMLALLEAGANPALRNKQGRTFAAYFAIHPKDSLMSSQAKSARGAVQQWLDRHGYSNKSE